MANSFPISKTVTVDVHGNVDPAGSSKSQKSEKPESVSISSIPNLIPADFKPTYSEEHPDRQNLHSALYEGRVQVPGSFPSEPATEIPQVLQLYSFADPYFHRTPFFMDYNVNPPELMEYVPGRPAMLPPGHELSWSQVPSQKLEPLAITEEITVNKDDASPIINTTDEARPASSDPEVFETLRKDPDWPLWRTHERKIIMQEQPLDLFATDSIASGGTELSQNLERPSQGSKRVLFKSKQRKKTSRWSPVWIIGIVLGFLMLVVLVVEVYFIITYATR